MEGFDSEISEQDKIKHRQMGEKHLLKIVTLFRRISTKIMKQPEYPASRGFFILPLPFRSLFTAVFTIVVFFQQKR